MDLRLRYDARLLAGMSVEYLCVRVSIDSFRQLVTLFGIKTKWNPTVLRPWHHNDTSGKWVLVQDWDALLKRLVSLAQTIMGFGIPSWEMFEVVDVAQTPGSAAAVAEPVIPECCPAPFVHTVHPEPVVLAESTPEELLEALGQEPVLLLPKEKTWKWKPI